MERRHQLPKKAKRSKPTKIIVVKTVAKATHKLNENEFKFKRRSLNRALQKTALDFKWRSVNIDAILPNQEANFEVNGEDLSDHGMELFWTYLSDDLQELELPRATPPKKTARVMNNSWNF